VEFAAGVPAGTDTGVEVEFCVADAPAVASCDELLAGEGLEAVAGAEGVVPFCGAVAADGVEPVAGDAAAFGAEAFGCAPSVVGAAP